MFTTTRNEWLTKSPHALAILYFSPKWDVTALLLKVAPAAFHVRWVNTNFSCIWAETAFFRRQVLTVATITLNNTYSKIHNSQKLPWLTMLWEEQSVTLLSSLLSLACCGMFCQLSGFILPQPFLGATHLHLYSTEAHLFFPRIFSVSLVQTLSPDNL